MRVQQVAAQITAVGQGTPWLFFDFYETPLNLSLLVSQDNGADSTLAVQYILDAAGNDGARAVSLSQSGTTITVVDSGPPLPTTSGGGLGHGLAAGDYVAVDAPPSIKGLYSVTSVTNATTYTLTAGTSQTLPAQLVSVRTGRVITAGAFASTGDGIIGADGAGITVRSSLVVNAPIFAARLLCTTVGGTTGVARLTSMQGGVSS